MAEPSSPNAAEWNKQNDSEDEDEIEEDVSTLFAPLNAPHAPAQYYNNKEAILFLIESTPTMLDPEYGTLSPLGAELRSTQGAKATHARSKLEVCLRCAYAMMKRKVISAPRDSIGIVVFNTVSLCSLWEYSGKTMGSGVRGEGARWDGLEQLGRELTTAFSVQAETQVVEDTTIKNCLLVKDLQVATAESIKAMRDLLAGAYLHSSPPPLPGSQPSQSSMRTPRC